MSANINTTTNGQNGNAVAAAEFIKGKGKTQSVWWLAAGSPKLTDDAILTFERIKYLLAPLNEAGQVVLSKDGTPAPFVRKVTPIDPETNEPLEGLSIIKGAGLSKRLGNAGGKRRTQWEPMQPLLHWERVVKPLMQSTGINPEGIFWLDSRLVIDCSMPNVAGLDWAKDDHDVRVSFVLDYSGAGCDEIVISLTRAVCSNTIALARIQANRQGSILRLRHTKGIVDAWEMDAVEFVEAAAHGAREYFSMVTAANGVNAAGRHDSIIAALFGDEPRVDEKTGAKLDADGNPILKSDGSPVRGRKALTEYRQKVEGFEFQLKRERENAEKTGINPDSLRVYWEAYTALWQHGAEVEVKGENQQRFPLHNSPTPMGNALALVADAKLTSDPLADLLAEAGLTGLAYEGADLSLEAAGISPWGGVEDPATLDAVSMRADGSVDISAWL